MFKLKISAIKEKEDTEVIGLESVMKLPVGTILGVKYGYQNDIGSVLKVTGDRVHPLEVMKSKYLSKGHRWGNSLDSYTFIILDNTEDTSFSVSQA